jgi:hypothetical protein
MLAATEIEGPEGTAQPQQAVDAGSREIDRALHGVMIPAFAASTAPASTAALQG